MITFEVSCGCLWVRLMVYSSSVAIVVCVVDLHVVLLLFIIINIIFYINNTSWNTNKKKNVLLWAMGTLAMWCESSLFDCFILLLFHSSNCYSILTGDTPIIKESNLQLVTMPFFFD